MASPSPCGKTFVLQERLTVKSCVTVGSAGNSRLTHERYRLTNDLGEGDGIRNVTFYISYGSVEKEYTPPRSNAMETAQMDMERTVLCLEKPY